MADSKLSELTAATSAAVSDVLYLVQSGVSKRITAGNLFANIDFPAIFKDLVQIQDENEMTSIGAIDITTNITKINDPDQAGALTIASGADGQMKFIIMTSNTGAHTLTLSGSGVEGSIAFDSAGDTATLMYTGTKWYMVGGTATIT